ncbi:MAG TPA: amidohydrolase family protein [Actinobacteria bacterium]|nr:amidohydrolase family protein [Actinomycetota bacterium]
MIRIDADLLIPGRGEPVPRGTVLLDGATISYAGPRATAPSTPEAEAFEVPVALPGLWECHGHFLGTPIPDLERIATASPVTLAAQATADLAATLAGGVTSVREVGGLGIDLREVVARGSIPGPTIHPAGAILSPTGGHADIHGLPLDFVRSLPERGLVFQELCDGVTECLRAVRRQLRRDAKVIKVCASGGVMSEVDHPIHQQFGDDELRAIVAEAERAERVVAAHCHGKPGIMAALRAGVKTIEHGTYLDEEAADLMLETGAILVPTRFVIDELLGMEDRLPGYAYEKAVAIAARHAEALELAVAKGIPIAMGTDIFVSGPLYGRNAREIRHLIDAGMSPLQAIEAATANGPRTLGPQAPRSGLLAPGYAADVVALDFDPLADPAPWGDPDRVTHVWKAGETVKRPAS